VLRPCGGADRTPNIGISQNQVKSFPLVCRRYWTFTRLARGFYEARSVSHFTYSFLADPLIIGYLLECGLSCNRGASLSFLPQRSCPVQRGGVSDDALAPCVLEPSGSDVDGDANIQQFEAQEYFIAREQVDPSFSKTG